MNNRTKKIITLILLVSVVIFSIPQETHARNLFRQFFRDLKRGSRFIVSLPDRATRWMGPVLGPIAATILTQNISAHHKFGQLFNNARRVNNAISDIEEQKRIMNEVRQMYRDQASELKKYVTQLEEARETLRDQLIDREVSMEDYLQTAIDLDQLISTVNEAANRFDNNAVNIKTDDIIKMATGNLLSTVIGEVKNAALDEINNEIINLINPDIIKTLISQDSEGFEALLDVLISGGLRGYDEKYDSDDLRNRVKDRIKQTLEDNKDALKDNMKDEIKNIIEEMIGNIEKDSGNIIDKVTETTDNVKSNTGQTIDNENPYSDDELAENLADIPVDEHGCRPGYIWKRMSGVGCVQESCGEVGAHYSYTQACICGVVDPKPGDKTKACMRPSNYIACPSCVYMCVDKDAECPPK